MQKPTTCDKWPELERIEAADSKAAYSHFTSLSRPLAFGNKNQKHPHPTVDDYGGSVTLQFCRQCAFKKVQVQYFVAAKQGHFNLSGFESSRRKFLQFHWCLSGSCTNRRR